MSRTPDIGVVGVRYWAYMAEVLTTCLDQIINGQWVKIPVNVLGDAQRFFSIILERTTGDVTFDHPLARTYAQAIALEILNNCYSLQSHALEEANRHFHRFAKFLEVLKQQPAVPPNDEDKKTATDLRDFFAALLRKNARKSRY